MIDELKYDIQDVVRNTLKEFFYQIPEVEISRLGGNYIVKFNLSPMDTKMFTASKLKKALSQFGKVSQSRFSHPKLTSGNTEFRYDITPTLKEIPMYSLKEALNDMKHFVNGSLEDFNPQDLMNKVMNTGESLHTNRAYKDKIYFISIFYEDWFGPRGIDNPDTRYWVDIVEEDSDGQQKRIYLDGRDLLSSDVVKLLNTWKNQTISEDYFSEALRLEERAYKNKIKESKKTIQEDYSSNLEEERKIQKYLNDNGLWADVNVDGMIVTVDISWGDWKHEHGRCKYLMDELGYKFMGEEVTEEDGSDTYSAIHYYIPKFGGKEVSESLKENMEDIITTDVEFDFEPDDTVQISKLKKQLKKYNLEFISVEGGYPFVACDVELRGKKEDIIKFLISKDYGWHIEEVREFCPELFNESLGK